MIIALAYDDMNPATHGLGIKGMLTRGAWLTLQSA